MIKRTYTFFLLGCLSLFIGATCLEKERPNGIKLVSLDMEDLTKLEWSAANGKKHAFVKIDGSWYYAGMEAVDSTKFNDYLLALSRDYPGEYVEHISLSDHPLLEKLVLYGNTMTSIPVLKVYRRADDEFPFLIQSTFFPDKFFVSDSNGIYKEIFLNLRQFWPDGQ